MNPGTVLIIGGRSDIGLALARRFAAAGYMIQLAARDAASLFSFQVELEDRFNVNVTLHELDILDTASFEPFLIDLPNFPDIAVSVVGLLKKQDVCECNLSISSLVMRSNFEGPALLAGLIANKFEEMGRGTFIGISSVAGERGRANNYVYGSAKAGYTAYLSGLRNRLAKKDIHVMTVLPGFVATRMTAGLSLPKRLTATPTQVAEAIFRATSRRKNYLYIKAVWRPIMAVIRWIPESIFKKMEI